MPTLKSLPDPTEIGKFAALDDSEAFESVFPVLERDPSGSPRSVIGCLLFRDGTTYAVAYDPTAGAWEQVTTSHREHHVFPDYEEFTQRHVAVIDSDINPEHETLNRLYDHLRDLYGDIFQDTLDDIDAAIEGLDPKSDRKEVPIACSCGTPEIAYLPVTDTIDVGRCQTCAALSQIRMDGEEIPTETVFTEEWLSADGPERIAPNRGEPDDAVYLVEETESPSRVDAAIYVLSLIAKLLMPRMSVYNHEVFSALVYVRDGTIAGYATWNESLPDDEPPIIRQLFLRDGYRRSGIGANILTTLVADGLDAPESVYFEEPNSEVWGLYARAKYEDERGRDSTLPEIVPISILEPRAAYPDGQDALDAMLMEALDVVFHELDEKYGSTGWELDGIEWDIGESNTLPDP